MSCQFIPLSGHRFDPLHDCTLHYQVDSFGQGPVIRQILVGEPGELAPSLLAVSDALIDYSLDTLVNKVCEIVAYVAAMMGFGMIVHLQIKETIDNLERPREIRRTVTYWCSGSVLDKDESLLGRREFSFEETIHSIRIMRKSNRMLNAF